MYSHRSSTGPVDLAFTDRYGGVSAVPFDSLNLALVGDDDPEARRRNTELLLEDFAPGGRPGRHGAGARRRGRPGAGVRGEQCDALVTDRPDTVLMVRVADCVPVLLADPDAGVVGAAHAGRPGVAAGVVARAASSGCARSAPPTITAWVGPHVCGRCYEVPGDLRAEVAAVEPATASTTSWGTPALDLGAGVRAQLERARRARSHDVSRCTLESPTSTPTAATAPAPAGWPA